MARPTPLFSTTRHHRPQVGAGRVEQGHDLARAVHDPLLAHLPYLSSAVIHVDPAGLGGTDHHAAADREHDHADEHSHHH